MTTTTTASTRVALDCLAWLQDVAKRLDVLPSGAVLEQRLLQWTTTHAVHVETCHSIRQSLFLQVVEPMIVLLVGPMEEEHEFGGGGNDDDNNMTEFSEWQSQDESPLSSVLHADPEHRRLGFLPSYVSNVASFKETSMSFATLIMLFVTLSTVFMVFLSCFYHSLKTSPLFTSPRRHRLPKLVPPPLPVGGPLSWVKVCFFLDDEEIIHRIGYDSLVFLRFHRLAVRCIVKMSVFSFVVLLPLNFTSRGQANAADLKEYVGSLFFTNFSRFTMSNIVPGSPRLWVHCFAAYLLTGIVVRELLAEYDEFHKIRHRYLLSREPHLRAVLVTNIPRHLRSPAKITRYFQHVYPAGAVKSVHLCQNLQQLERLARQRTRILWRLEQELLVLCRTEKRKLYHTSRMRRWLASLCGRAQTTLGGWLAEASQERLAKLYQQLEDVNAAVEQEQRRRRRVMKRLDHMPAGVGASDIDYVLAAASGNPSMPASLHLNANQQQQEAWARKILHLDGAGNARQAPPQHQPHGNMTNQQQQHHDTGQTIHEGNEDVGESGSSETVPGANTAHRPLPQETTGLPFGNNHNNLRARSPTVVGPSHAVASGGPSTATSATNRPLTASTLDQHQYQQHHVSAHAKDAITRYGRFAKDKKLDHDNEQQTDQYGRHHEPSIPSEGKIEDHINEVTDKAFVVMRTFAAATIAIQSMHSSKPGSMQVTTAPEPRDILWNNIYVSKGAHRTRSYIGEFLVLLIIAFYVVPVALVSLLVSESALISSSPRLAQLDQASAFFSAAIALVQPICIVGLQQLLPPLFILIGKAEGLTAFSEVQMRAFSRYFLFQVVNVFLVTTIAGSIFDTVAIIIETPERAFEMLGNSLPRLSSFFITFVTVKTFLALGSELVRAMALGQAVLRYCLFPNATLRMNRTVVLGMRAIDDPGWFPHHKILAQDMLVVVVSVVFAVVAPMVLLPCALFCLFSRIMWTHHHMYVYESVFESGGQFWPKIFRRFVFGLIIAQMTITGQFILKDARHEAYATMALSVMTYFFLRSTRARYDPTSSALPLEVATVMDLSLQQEEEARTRHEAAVAVHSPRQANDPGTRIGRFDPFRNAYVQPALRANPRARPEQPFPAAQLGRETLDGSHLKKHHHMGSTAEDSVDEDWQDTGATVRLKCMNLHDRKLVDRWWKEQFQRAGEQAIWNVLFGEECGSLRLSGAPQAAAEGVTASAHRAQPVLAESHSFV